MRGLLLALVIWLAAGCCLKMGDSQFCGFRHIDLSLETDHDGDDDGP